MHRFETIDLGSYRGQDYFLVGFVEPDPATVPAFDPAVDATAYGVALARAVASGANIEIVRMDTAHDQGPHLDLVYLPPGVDRRRRVELEGHYSYERMRRYLLAHWKDFVDGYRYYNE